MRDGDAVPNPGGELSLPFQYRLKDVLYSRVPHGLSCVGLRSIAAYQELHQFTQHALLALGP